MRMEKYSFVSTAALEEKDTPLACKAFNYLEDLKMYLRAGCEKTSVGTETDRPLSKLPKPG